MGVVMDQEGPVAVLRMDWPDRHNALGPGEADEIGAALDAASDSSARVLVITGSYAFCVGGGQSRACER